MNQFLKAIFQVYVWLFILPIAWLWTALVAVCITFLTWLGAGAWADRHIARLWGRVILWITPVRVNIHNQDVIKKHQSYVIVANHQSIYDIVAVYAYLPLVFKWVMKIELRKTPFIGFTCHLMGHIFVDRKNRQSAVKTMQQAGDKLTGGTSVFFFPEGTRNNGHGLLPFKKGAFKMAESLALPILPVTIKGADKVMPAKSLRILPGTIELIFHDPVTPKLATQQSSETLIEEIREQISNAL